MRSCSATRRPPFCSLFFFNDTATTEIYTLSLHDALPILTDGPPPKTHSSARSSRSAARKLKSCASIRCGPLAASRSEEHTSELQSHSDLVCRLLLEKKKIKDICQCILVNLRASLEARPEV